MVETYQFQIPKIEVTFSESCKRAMQRMAERTSAICEEYGKIVEYIEENICKPCEQLNLFIHSISWIKFEPFNERPVKPVIEPYALFRNSEQDICKRLFSLKAEVYDDARQRVEYRQLIEEDVNWGIALRLISRYESTESLIDRERRLGRRLLQWIHGLTRDKIISGIADLSKIAFETLLASMFGLALRMFFGL